MKGFVISFKLSVCPNTVNFYFDPYIKCSGWLLDMLSDAIFGCLYCNKLDKVKIVEFNEYSRKILSISDIYLFDIGSASDTNMVEIVL